MDPLLPLAGVLGATLEVPPVTPDDGRSYVSSPADCSRAAEDPGGVLVLGDSLTRKGAAELGWVLLRQGRQYCLDGRNSRTTARAIPVLRGYVERQQLPGTVVIALGTNDTLGSPASFRARLRELLALVPQDRRVLLVDVWYTGHDAEATAINRVIAEEAATRRATVVGFHDWVRERPGLLLDHVHLTAEGSLARAWLIGGALDRRT